MREYFPQAESAFLPLLQLILVRLEDRAEKPGLTQIDSSHHAVLARHLFNVSKQFRVGSHSAQPQACQTILVGDYRQQMTGHSARQQADEEIDHRSDAEKVDRPLHDVLEPTQLPVALDSAEAAAIINLLIPLVFRCIPVLVVFILRVDLQISEQDVLRNLV